MLVDQQLEHYLLETLDPKAEWEKELEDYAKANHIPIMEPLGINFLQQMVRLKKPKRILEIGTAIGYSALQMATAYPKASIVTIERDQIRYDEAVKNIRKLDKQEDITVLFGDALEITNQVEQYGPYDLLFIDAAKGQYQRFFEMYNQFLTEDGLIISDNVLFKGLVADTSQAANDRINKLAKKIGHYNEWLINHPTYKTTIIPLGDGIAVSVKR
ncbi:O-methyltransferase [Aquibacillus sediminis]|uniref:O-methyltransferase n=1 Tax=Aquibacillus sediminis TaxID=2574734 RepID=UPI0011093354|nr:O-methyltransferase [Aquibacillus sediminis]